MSPRIEPGARPQIGWLNAAIVRVLALGTAGRPANVFTTLARHPQLFRKWLWFAGGLMPGGLLPRRDTELLILRTAHNCACDYEWLHHRRIGLAAGLREDQLAALRLEQPPPAAFSERQRQLVRAADELHRDRRISDELWPTLSGLLSEPEAIELCMLVGHYQMLAMTLRSLEVEPDPVPAGRGGRSLGARLAARALARSRR